MEGTGWNKEHEIFRRTYGGAKCLKVHRRGPQNVCFYILPKKCTSIL